MTVLRLSRHSFFGHLGSNSLRRPLRDFSPELKVFYKPLDTIRMEKAEDTPATPETHCPGLPGRGCGHFIAGWDDHLLCVTCRPRGEPPCDGTFSCPVCSMWDQDHQLRLTQRPAKKHKSCSVTSASPPPPSEVNLEPVEFVDQPSYIAPFSLRRWPFFSPCWDVECTGQRQHQLTTYFFYVGVPGGEVRW